MKTALKIGFSTTTQHWKSTLLHSKYLIFTFVLLTLLESFFLHEICQLIGGIFGSSSYLRSIINVDVFDFSGNKDSLLVYLLNLNRNFFYEFLVLNSFFLGVYYHHTGFPQQSSSGPKIDNILDVPIEQNQRPTLGLVLQYIQKETRTYYFKIILLFIVIQFLGAIVGNLIFNILYFAGQIYELLFRLIPYLLLLLLYLKWLEIPFAKFWENKHKWLVIVICAILVPNIGLYIGECINSIIYVVSNLFFGFGDTLLYFLSGIAYYMLLVPFISIFYSQTLIYFKNEEEA